MRLRRVAWLLVSWVALAPLGAQQTSPAELAQALQKKYALDSRLLR
ncbi:MAG: hypothetical protein QM736_09975 [Vicinamibacterales bacterium]